MSNCKHKNKMVQGEYHTEDKLKMMFQIDLEEDREYDDCEIEDIVDNTMAESEEEFGVVIEYRKYEVICKDCGKEIEIY